MDLRRIRTISSGPQVRLAAIAGLLLAGLAVWAVVQGSAGQTKDYYLLATPESKTTTSSEKLRVGMPAPDFQLDDVNTGQPVSLSGLRGRPVWINFWATWCPACKVELPTMKQWYDRYKSKGLALVGVDMREDPDQVRAFTKSNGYDWLFVIDADVQVRERYDTIGIPNHVFVDAQGIVRAIEIGELKENSIEGYLAKIMGD